jgi:hypothetical protein
MYYGLSLTHTHTDRKDKETDKYVYFKNPENMIYCKDLLLKNVELYGENYDITFAEFMQELSEYIGKLTEAKGGDDVEEIDVEMDVGATVDVGQRKYEQLGAFGRMLYDWSNWWEHYKRTLERFHVWSGLIVGMQAQYGSSISTYFIFTRFLFYLNFLYCVGMTLFLFLPWYVCVGECFHSIFEVLLRSCVMWERKLMKFTPTHTHTHIHTHV